METDSAEIIELLKTILKASPGIQFVLLSDPTGLVLSVVKKFLFSDQDVDYDKMAVLASAVCNAGQEQGICTDYGSINNIILEYNQGKLLIGSIPTGIVVVGCDKHTNLGLVRSRMIRSMPELQKILKKHEMNLNEDMEVIADHLKGILHLD